MRTRSSLSKLKVGVEGPSVRIRPATARLAARGPLDFSVGIVAALSVPLADAGIGIFVVSTYDTDYLFVRDADLAGALAALRAAGHAIG